MYIGPPTATALSHRCAGHAQERHIGVGSLWTGYFSFVTQVHAETQKLVLNSENASSIPTLHLLGTVAFYLQYIHVGSDCQTAW